MPSRPRPHPYHSRAKSSRASRKPAEPELGVPSLALGGLLSQRSLDPPDEVPTVQLRAVRFHPWIFRKMARELDPAQPGDLVRVLDKQGAVHGYALYNPRSNIALRMLQRGDTPPDEAVWTERLLRAVKLRREVLGLDSVADTYRLVHSEGDGISGLVADRLGDVLSIEIFSLGILQRIEAILSLLLPVSGAKHFLVRTDRDVQKREGCRVNLLRSPDLPNEGVVQEHGLRYHVDYEGGHKTGFFCDQRDTRLRMAKLCRGRSVLDLCCYSGGFALTAKVIGKARQVQAVDLDEEALKIAARNATLNRTRVDFTHADAFEYLRDRIRAQERYEVVIVDPPKFIPTREDLVRGRQKYFDLLRLALQVVEPGGLMLACSCSGLFSAEDLLQTLGAASRQPPELPGAQPRGLRVLERRGAGADHPLNIDCPENEYLKAFLVQVD